MDKEMMKALEADGEYLSDMTGEDHGPVFFHIKHDPLICPGRDDHEFTGWRDLHNDKGQVCGGETVCKHCGIGAMEHTMALPDDDWTL